MTTAQIKEQLSIHYLGALASWAGHLMKLPTGNPTGVDVTISGFQKVKITGRTRHIDTGKAIDIQLKCTARKKLSFPVTSFKYDLKVKNYNDLVWRRKFAGEVHANPLLMIILVLPLEKRDWVSLKANSPLLEGFLTLGGAAFWYFPNDEDDFTKNKMTRRIDISIRNKVDLEFVRNIFNQIIY